MPDKCPREAHARCGPRSLLPPRHWGCRSCHIRGTVVACLEPESVRRSTPTCSPMRADLTHGSSDAELIDEALSALLARYRGAEIDDAYAQAYSAHPLDEPDEWGDLASFRSAASAT